MLSIMSHELPHHASSVTLQGKSFLSFTEPVSLQKSSHASASINPVDGGCHFFPVPNYIDPVAYIDSALNRRNSEQCTKQEEPISRDSAASVADFKLSREGQNYGQYRDMGAVYIGGSNSKDRHSKVITAKGARDRRIRLSVETAIRLFHVQDMLGFQHPSEAVEWLICTCQAAIQQLPPGLSESLMPAFFPPPIIYPPNSAEAVSGAVKSKGRITKCKKKAKAGGIAKPQESHRRFVITDDRRQKARERARERTKCKLQTSQTQNPCIGEQRYQPSVFQNEEKPNYCSNPFDLSEISVLSNCNYRKDPKEKYHICAQEETSALDEELNYVLLW